MATATATAAEFYLTSTWTCQGGRIVQGPSTYTAQRVFSISGIPSGAVIQSADLTANYGSPLSGAQLMQVNSENVDVSAIGPQTVPVAPSVSGNGDYVLIFSFRAYGDPSMADGEHSGVVTVSGATLTVTYEAEPPAPPEPEPVIDWGEGGRPISVFAGDATRFENNGLAVLSPLEGRMRMVAGGVNEITMRHPIDREGKWQYLVPGNIIRVPVPEEVIENTFIGEDVDLYRTSGTAALREGMNEGYSISYPAWDAELPYVAGDRVTYAGWGNYQCLQWIEGSRMSLTPPPDSAWWKKIADETYGDPVLAWLPAGTELYLLEDMGGGWYRMSTPMGIEGYVRSGDVVFVRHITPEAADERVITEQLYRVKAVTVNTEKMELTLNAEHVSYDLAAILIRDVDVSQVSPSAAISRAVDGFMSPYRGQIATNLTAAEHGTYTGSFSGKNGIFALLDPDSGIVSAFDARFSRDNWDLFILRKTNTDRGFRLRFGKNIRGVTWKRSVENLVTRVVPVARDQEGNDLYLPEGHVDSENISAYPVIITQRLPVKGQIGKDDGTGTGFVWTAEALYEEMRSKARERFTVDHADVPYQEVTVDFEQLGDTAEYPWLKRLERVLLYDLVRVEDARVTLDAALTVTELEWDYIRKKVTAIKVATAADDGLQTVAGYNIGNNSIGSEKLTQAAIAEIAGLLS